MGVIEGGGGVSVLDTFLRVTAESWQAAALAQAFTGKATCDTTIPHSIQDGLHIKRVVCDVITLINETL